MEGGNPTDSSYVGQHPIMIVLIQLPHIIFREDHERDMLLNGWPWNMAIRMEQGLQEEKKNKRAVKKKERQTANKLTVFHVLIILLNKDFVKYGGTVIRGNKWHT